MPQRNQNNMPEDFEPPVPAWAADWATDATSLTTGIFAVQGEETEPFNMWISSALYNAEFAPELIDKAQFTDLNGIVNTVYIAYWRNENQRAWWSNQEISSWWQSDDRLSENVGYWYEHYTIAIERLETLHSTPNAHGVANLATDLEGPIDEHGYSGAARDRIQQSRDKDLSNALDVKSLKLTSQSSNGGKHITVIPPAKMCVIRSGQDWVHCEDAERNFYLNEVHPSLVEGMSYLSNHPQESRCLSMRLMHSLDADGNKLDQTFGLGYAIDILAFEKWAKSHPTHLKIFGSFMSHASTFGDNMKLKLWHEVSVLDQNAGQFIYINCHSNTGLLRYC